MSSRARSPEPVFVVIEEPNGVGKTAVVEALVESLEAWVPGEVHRTAEPSSSPLGKAIREMEATMSPEALALSCVADRFDHVAREVVPRLHAGAWVIGDRRRVGRLFACGRDR